VAQITGVPLAALQGASVGTLVTEIGGVTVVSGTSAVHVGNAGQFAAYTTFAAGAPKNGVSGFRAASNSVETNSNFTSGAAANRFGVAWGPSTFSMSGNGAVVTAGSGTAAFSGTAYLGSYSSGGFLNGYIRSLALYNQRLPDATLQAKSVVGAPF
jgi:hypothetical protein